MLFAALGEGTVSVATGYLMKIFGPETLCHDGIDEFGLANKSCKNMRDS